jgi:flagellar hook protein FlgE
MYTAISSLNAHQSWMDVVGNNLANVNTPGYKTAYVRFQDQFSQMLRAGSAPAANSGGINPMQIGLGMRLGTIGMNFTQGALQATGRVSDLAIQGDGFFVYRDPNDALYYSRDGSIDLDAEGYLVNTTTGMQIQGWTASGNPPAINTGLALGGIQIPLNATGARQTTSATVRGNLNASQAAATPVTMTYGVYDAFGQLRTLTVNFTRTGANTWTWNTTSGGTGSGTLTFDPATGAITSGGTGTVAIPAGANGAQGFNFNLDFTNITQLDTENSPYVASQDGLSAGAVSGFKVEDNTGRVFALFSNGLEQLVGQLAVSTFTNPAGLIKEGQNLFSEGPNSGEPNIGPGYEAGRGAVVSGVIEGSNVDMAQEFTNLILAQRGFQASSRVITTSDEMLQELVNIKR